MFYEITRKVIVAGGITLACAIILCTSSVEAAFTASSASSSSITLNWTSVGDDGGTGRASVYDIRYSLNLITDANWSAATQALGEPLPQNPGMAESFTITGLLPNTTYYLALKVGDEIPNWSPMSNVVQKTTAQETIPPSDIADLILTASSPTSVSLQWTAPGDDSSVGTASLYDLKYSNTPITALNWSSATSVVGMQSPSISGTVETVTVTGLSSNMTYYFAIKSADEVPNWSSISNVLSGSTGTETTAPATIVNLGAGSETETSMTLSWTAPGDDGNIGTASTYDIRYSTTAITSANWDSATQVTGESVPKSAGSVESFVVTSLSSNTLYYFAIKTADEVPNWSLISNVVSRTTGQDQTPPSAINDLQAVTGTSNGEILIGWTAPGDIFSNATVAGYEIRYSTNQINDVNWQSATEYTGAQVTAQAMGNAQGIALSGLTPAQFYYVVVRSQDSAANWSQVSNPASAVAGFSIVTGGGDVEPLLSSPAAGATVETSRPLLVIENSNSATLGSYTYMISKDSSFASIELSATVEEELGGFTSWVVDVPLIAGPTYYWKVQSSSGVYSKISSFTVNPKTHVFPNPFRSEDMFATFVDLSPGTDLMLVSVSGDIVRSWDNLESDQMTWDGRNSSGAEVASGVYLWYADAGSKKGKLVVVR